MSIYYCEAQFSPKHVTHRNVPASQEFTNMEIFKDCFKNTNISNRQINLMRQKTHAAMDPIWSYESYDFIGRISQLNPIKYQRI